MHPSRPCTVCETHFFPYSYRSQACSQRCQRKAEKVRAKGRAYDRGERDITPDTLAILLRVLEADAIAAERARLKAEEKELAEDLERERLIEQQEREWVIRGRELAAQRVARGWKPISVTACPQGSRKRFTVPLPPHLQSRMKGSDHAQRI